MERNRLHRHLYVALVAVVGTTALAALLRQGSALAGGQATHVPGRFNGVSCYTVNDCLAVGDTGSASARHPTAFRWNGRSWSTIMPVGSGASSTLNGVSCVAAFCMMVGATTDKSGTKSPLSETWDKSGTPQAVPAAPPTDSQAARLNGVSCLSSSFCMAVGDYTSTDGHAYMLSMTYDGHAWTVQPRIRMVTQVGIDIVGVSCVPKRYLPQDWCQAVGWFVDPSRHHYPVAFSWDGSVWTREATGNQGGWRGSELRGVSCRQGLCMAVGVAYERHDFEPVGQQLEKNPAGSRRPGRYSFVPAKVPRPGKGDAVLNGVSCGAPDQCRGAGTYYDLHLHAWRTLIEVWQDDWSLNSAKLCSGTCQSNVPNSEYGNNVLNAVSCKAYNACLAAGRADDATKSPPTAPLGLWLAHTEGYDWSLTPGP